MIYALSQINLRFKSHAISLRAELRRMDCNSGLHAPDLHASSPLGIPFGIQFSDAIH
jgi:hypothetical protein